MLRFFGPFSGMTFWTALKPGIHRHPAKLICDLKLIPINQALEVSGLKISFADRWFLYYIPAE